MNFNCQKDIWSARQDVDLKKLQQNFEDSWHTLDASTQHHYHAVYDALKDLMPFKNYDVTHDEAMLRARCNIVIESYSSDTSIAFSEKIFRALVLPVPWTLYGGLYSVARLESLGFDCMSDIINHNHYDRLKQIEDKVHIFVWKTLDSLRLLDQMDCKMLADRCRLAAQHNQQLLKDFHQNWPRDFANWLANTAQLL